MKISALLFCFWAVLNLPLAFSNDCPLKRKNEDYLKRQLERSSLVVVGVILETPTKLDFHYPNGMRLKEVVYNLQVLRYLKSKTHCDANVITLTDFGSSPCCPQYLEHTKVGDTVLVYAGKREQFFEKFGNTSPFCLHYSIISPKSEHKELGLAPGEFEFLNDSEKWRVPDKKINFTPKKNVELAPKPTVEPIQNSDSNFLKISLLANAILILAIIFLQKRKLKSN